MHLVKLEEFNEEIPKKVEIWLHQNWNKQGKHEGKKIFKWNRISTKKYSNEIEYPQRSMKMPNQQMQFMLSNYKINNGNE